MALRPRVALPRAVRGRGAVSRSAEALRQAEALFDRIADLAPNQRAMELASIAARDQELAREVASLLELAERSAGFLERPALGGDFRLLPAEAQEGDAAPDAFEGRTVGRYRIERRLASGGMGTVYLAARADEQFAQRVALKIVKRGLDSEEIL